MSMSIHLSTHMSIHISMFLRSYLYMSIFRYEGTEMLPDLLSSARLGPWYSRMQALERLFEFLRSNDEHAIIK